MTFGERLKKLRVDANLTQKDLADKLFVTYQTVSKWENDINEPDFNTLKELAKILNCSVDYLLSNSDDVEENKNLENEEANTELNSNNPEVVVIPVIKNEEKSNIVKPTYCADCHKEIKDNDKSHQVNRNNNGINEVVSICEECYQKHAALNEEKIKLNNQIAKQEKKKSSFKWIRSRDDKVPLIIALISGAIFLIASIVCCVIYYKNIGLLASILIPIIGTYTIIATVYCITALSYISEVFIAILSKTIHFPRVIFSFGPDGLKFLIFMKVIFAIISVIFGFAIIVLSVAVSAFLSFFSFIPILIYNKNHY